MILIIVTCRHTEVPMSVTREKNWQQSNGLKGTWLSYCEVISLNFQINFLKWNHPNILLLYSGGFPSSFEENPVSQLLSLQICIRPHHFYWSAHVDWYSLYTFFMAFCVHKLRPTIFRFSKTPIFKFHREPRPMIITVVL